MPTSPSRALLALVPAFALGLVAAPAGAATFAVTSNADSGAGSLRDALVQAQAAPGADTVTVPPMTITLTSARLQASGEVTIAGAGQGQTIIDGAGARQLFGSNSAATRLSLADLTLRNGRGVSGGAIQFIGASLTIDRVTFSTNTSGGAGSSGFGAAINVSGTAATALTIRDSTFDANVAGGGGGFAHGIIDAEGGFDLTATIQRSTFSNNQVGGGGNGANQSAGTGVVYFNATGGHAVDATIEASTFTDNATGGGTPKGGDGSGMVENAGAGTLRVLRSTFARNTAGGGGLPGSDNNPGGSGFGAAISASEGSLVADGNTFTQNRAGGGGSTSPRTGSPGGDGRGGAINVTSVAATITNNTFFRNTVGGNGGGGGGKRGNGGAVYAVGASASAPFTFTGNLVEENRTAPDSTTDGSGGGLHLEVASGTHTVANNTFHENFVGSGGAAGSTHQGGAIFVNVSGGSALLRNLTITDNSVRNGGSSGGGIWSQGDVKIANSILADNLMIVGSPTGQNCAPANKPTSEGHNIESGASCALGHSTDRSNTAPSLGPLEDNGGPTLTRAPTQSPASPALDSGDNSLCPSTDQRGATRPGGGTCDVGAVEITPPGITVGGASADGASATLAFGVDTGAAPTTYRVEYGPAGGALASTAETTLPGAAGATPLSVPLGGLAAGTTYQYELVAVNRFGTTRSGVRLVTTTAPAAAPPVANPPVGDPPIVTPLPALGLLSFKGSTKKATQGKSIAFTYGLNREAKVKLTFTQLIPGRKKTSRSRCSRSQKKGRRCTISKAVTSLSQNGKTGTNKLTFTGKFGRKKTVLPAGRYKVTLTATAPGQKAVKKTASLTVVKKKRSRRR